jgi:hypothetical protein
LEEEEIKSFTFFRNIWSLYDKRTLLLIGLTFFNEGAEFMTILACTIQFYEFWEMEPQYASLHMALICIPQGLSFVFGLLADTTNILG